MTWRCGVPECGATGRNKPDVAHHIHANGVGHERWAEPIKEEDVK